MLRAACVLLAVACGKGAVEPPADALAEVERRDLPAVNAAVPEALRPKLELGAVLTEKGRSVAVIPKGWKASDVIPGTYRPGDESLGFTTQVSVSTNCDGTCEPKNWADVVDKVELAQLRGAGFQIRKDEPIAGGRAMIATQDRRVFVVVAKWNEGARRYHVCRANLDAEIAEAAPAFELACRALRPLEWK